MKSPREEVESKKKDLTGTAFKRQGGGKGGETKTKGELQRGWTTRN